MPRGYRAPRHAPAEQVGVAPQRRRLTSFSSSRFARSSWSSVDLLTDAAPTSRLTRALIDAVLLAGPARDRADQRAALGAQALALLERRLRLDGAAAAAAGVVVNAASAGEAAGGAGSANSCSASPGCVVCSTSSSRRAHDDSARNASPVSPRSPRSATGSPCRLEDQRVVALLLDLDRELLQARVRRQEDVRHLHLGRRRAPDEAPDHLAEEELGARGRRVDADPQARDVDALGDHQHRHQPRRRARPRSARSAPRRPPRRSARCPAGRP